MRYQVNITDEVGLEVDVGPGPGQVADLRRAEFTWEVRSEEQLRELVGMMGGAREFAFNPGLGQAARSVELWCDGESVGVASVVIQCDGVMRWAPVGVEPVYVALEDLEREARLARVQAAADARFDAATGQGRR